MHEPIIKPIFNTDWFFGDIRYYGIHWDYKDFPMSMQSYILHSASSFETYNMVYQIPPPSIIPEPSTIIALLCAIWFGRKRQRL